MATDHIIEDNNGTPLPESLQYRSPAWSAICSAIASTLETHGPLPNIADLVERTDEAMRRIAPLALALPDPPDPTPLPNGA